MARQAVETTVGGEAGASRTMIPADSLLTAEERDMQCFQVFLRVVTLFTGKHSTLSLAVTRFKNTEFRKLSFLNLEFKSHHTTEF